MRPLRRLLLSARIICHNCVHSVFQIRHNFFMPASRDKCRAFNDVQRGIRRMHECMAPMLDESRRFFSRRRVRETIARCFQRRSASQRPLHADVEDLPLHVPEPPLPARRPAPLARCAPRLMATFTAPDEATEPDTSKLSEPA